MAPNDKWMEEVRCSELSLVVLFHQMAVLFCSGLSLVEILLMKADETDDPQLSKVIKVLVQRLESGHSLDTSMALFPRVFSRMSQVMVRIGTETGSLAKVLEHLSLWYQRDYDLKKRFWAAISYPVLILVVSLVMSLIIYGTVLPGLLETLDGLGVELHWTTRVVRFFSDMASEPIWWGVFALMGFAAYRACRVLTKDPAFMLKGYRLALITPLVGPLVECFHASRYAAAVALLIKSGTDILKTVKLAAHSSGSPLFLDDLKELSDALIAGSLLSEHMAANADIYPPLLAKMAVAGEESAKLDHLFERASYIFEEEMEYRLQVLNAGLEPLLLALISAQVGFVMVSVYISVYSCLNQLNPY